MKARFARNLGQRIGSKIHLRMSTLALFTGISFIVACVVFLQLGGSSTDVKADTSSSSPAGVVQMSLEESYLLHFSAGWEKENVHLHWVTAVEVNTLHFTLYRSTDGRVYDEIKRMTGNGTTAMPHQYEFFDTTAPAGRVYYRLTETDYEGNTRVYEPVAVNKPTKKNLALR